jgi:hypothetical protein
VAFSPRETSLSVNRYRTEQEEHEASFFQQLEAEVSNTVWTHPSDTHAGGNVTLLPAVELFWA